MKKTIKKLVICILIVLMINNFLLSNFSFADTNDDLSDWLEDILGTVVGLLTWPIRIIALAAGLAMNTLTGGIAYSQGKIDENGNIDSNTGSINTITPFDIFFNKIAIVDVNFFNIGTEDNIINNIRTSVAAWYYVMRNIASAILLCILIYVGIRMAISTVASDKAAYKKMLVDWVCSLALIFLLQYIIIFTLNVNEIFIKALSNIDDGTKLSKAMTEIGKTALGVDVNAIAATVVYCMLVAQTLGLLITYFNRMLKIAFLIIIAPLITLTYSIDKMGDGKAQALGTWLKEFIYTVLIQTFHCIIYMAFISMALSILNPDSDELVRNKLAAAILAMLCVKFTKEGEKILGKIFKFSEATSDTSLAVGMAASAMALSKAKSIGKGTRTAINGVKNFKGNIKNFGKNAKIDALAAKTFLSSNGGKTYAQAKEEAKQKVEENDAEKEAKKAESKAQRYGVNTNIKDKDKLTDPNNQDYANEVKQEFDRIKGETPGISENVAKAKARANVANKKRTEGFNSKHPKISSARGTMNKLNTIRKESETAKVLGDIAHGYVSAGLGTFAGSATYGATGNASQALMIGTATYKGSQEFLKSSTATLVNNSSKAAEKLGANSPESAKAIGEQALAMAPTLSDPQELQSYLDSLLSQVEAMLESLGADDATKKSIKTSIKNTVASEVKKDPSIGTDKLMEKILNKGVFDQATNKNGDKIDVKGALNGNAQFESAVTQVADTNRYKIIYDDMQQASNLGIKPETYIEELGKNFRGYSSPTTEKDRFVSNEEIIRNIASGGEENKPQAVTDEQAQQYFEGRTEEKQDEIIKACDERVKQAETDYKTAKEEKDKIEAKANEIKAELERVTEDLKKASSNRANATDSSQASFYAQQCASLTQEQNTLRREQGKLIKKQGQVEQRMSELSDTQQAFATSLASFKAAKAAQQSTQSGSGGNTGS